MVLAAGLGVRMRPITDRLPKPLIAIAGRSMLDRCLDALAAAGAREAVVNIHHLAHLVEAHVAGRLRPKVVLSHETKLLETGGGVTKALPLLGPDAFFMANGDILWRDGATPALPALAEAWDDRRMDGLLLLQPVADALGYHGAGDFRLDGDGRLIRRCQGETAPFLFAGLQILHPRLFANAPAGAFSVNLLYDRAIALGRLFGLVHDGGWCHVGTPADIPVAEAFISRWDRTAGTVPPFE